MAEAPGNLWALLDDRQRAVVRANAEVRDYPAGAVIIREGDRSAWVLVLLSGLVKITSVAVGGHEAVLAVRVPGDILGEMAVMDGRPRSASAVAVEPVSGLWLSATAFAEVLRAEPVVATVLLRIMAARLRYANERRTEFGDSTSAQRLAGLLVDLADRFGRRGRHGTVIGLRVSQTDLAGLAATSREAVTRTLRAFREEGLLSTGRRRVVVHDVAALRRVASPHGDVHGSR